MTKIIIGLTGKAGSGKDTVASFLDKKNTDVFAFADPLKHACKILFNFTEEQLYDPYMKEQIDIRWNKSPREIFQWLGTDVIRKHIKEDFFIINMKNKIENSDKNIIITDVRFDNEAEFIKSIGGIIVKINRPNSKTTDHCDHLTEKGINEKFIDYIIINDGNLEFLKKNIIDLF